DLPYEFPFGGSRASVKFLTQARRKITNGLPQKARMHTGAASCGNHGHLRGSRCLRDYQHISLLFSRRGEFMATAARSSAASHVAGGGGGLSAARRSPGSQGNSVVHSLLVTLGNPPILGKRIT